jgi:hypothetical protein
MNTVPTAARIARPRAALLLTSLAVVLGGCATTQGNSLDRAVRCEAGELAACDREHGSRYGTYGGPYDLRDAYRDSLGEFEFWYGTPYPYGVGPYPYGVGPYPFAIAPYPYAASPYPYGVAPYPRGAAPYPDDGHRGDWRHRDPRRGGPGDGRDPRFDRGPDHGPNPDDRRWRDRVPPPNEPGRWTTRPAPTQRPGAPPDIAPPPRAPAPSAPPQFAPPTAPREHRPPPPAAIPRQPEMRTQPQ